MRRKRNSLQKDSTIMERNVLKREMMWVVAVINPGRGCSKPLVTVKKTIQSRTCDEAAMIAEVSALEDAESVRVRLQKLGPEASEGLARTMARMVLAGGQLKRAIDDLLPLAIEAVLTRPNRASASRRLLLEAGNDAVEAGLQLRDAARRLEMLDRLRPLLDPDATLPPIPDLDEATDRLSDTLDRLAERLREVIEQEL